jgi:hypothetical protein
MPGGKVGIGTVVTARVVTGIVVVTPCVVTARVVPGIVVVAVVGRVLTGVFAGTIIGPVVV